MAKEKLGLDGIAAEAVCPEDIAVLSNEELNIIKNTIHKINEGLTKNYDPSCDNYCMELTFPRRALASALEDVYRNKGWLGIRAIKLSSDEEIYLNYRFTFRKQPVEKQGQ